MTDDDRTVDADPATMAELRRLADAAKASMSNDNREPSDVTVDADPVTMAELRRFADEARRSAASTMVDDVPDRADDHTVDADGSEMEALRQYAAEAQRSDVAEPITDLPPPGSALEPPSPSPAAPPLTDLPQLRERDAWQTPVERTAPPGPPPNLPDHTLARSATPNRPASPPVAPHSDGETWRPPPRMVMPTEPEKKGDVHHGPWRTIAFVLAGVVAVLLTVFLVGAFTGADGGEEPPADSTPGSSVGIDAGDGDGLGGGG